MGCVWGGWEERGLANMVISLSFCVFGDLGRFRDLGRFAKSLMPNMWKF